jgi:uncharacterized protein (TIGR03435 family)
MSSAVGAAQTAYDLGVVKRSPLVVVLAAIAIMASLTGLPRIAALSSIRGQPAQTSQESSEKNTPPAGQTSAAPAPAFAAVSIHPMKASSGASPVKIGWFTPDEFTSIGLSVKDLVRNAYGVQDDQVYGEPKWADSEVFAIDAKLDEGDAHEMQTLDRDTRNLEQQKLFQQLLADRFKLVVHREPKSLQRYVLRVAKGGPKLEPWKPGESLRANTPLFAGEIDVRGLPISFLALRLSQTADTGRRVVMDETGLTGKYDFTLRWAPSQPRPDLADSNTPDNSSEPPLPIALKEQLGLTLLMEKTLVDTIVIDHIEEPTPN